MENNMGLLQRHIFKKKREIHPRKCHEGFEAA